MITYKGLTYETGNEYHGLIELWQNGVLKHIVKKRKKRSLL